MKILNRFLLLFLIFISLLLLQSNGFLNIGGIAPNLILIGFLISSFVLPSCDTKFIFILLLSLLGVSFIWFSFWLPVIFLAGLLGGLFSFIKKILSGDIFIDYLLSAVVATFLFYITSYALGFGGVIWSIIIWEIIYNIIIGEFILYILNKIKI